MERGGRTLDVVDLRDFYGDGLGQSVQHILRARIRTQWPNLRGERLLGHGFATPYLGPFRGEAERVLAFMPAAQGVVNWPSSGPSASALVVGDMMPLGDAAVDRVLLVHALEVASDPVALLREVWRVLAPGGRMLAVVPNRRGLWARFDSSPFGYGSPFSRRQLTGVLRESLFSPVSWSEALFMMPTSRTRFPGSTLRWERLGARFWPGFSGVILVEATKQLYQGLPARRAVVKPVPAMRPRLIPAGVTTAGPAPRAGS